MRLTEKDTQHFSYNLDTDISSDDTNGYDVRGGNHVSEVIAKLGQLEDILEKHNIEDIKELDNNLNVLHVFQNALIVKPKRPILTVDDHSKDAIVYSIQHACEIMLNDMDSKLKNALREWVLKNAFPKELAELEEIKKVMPLNNEKAKKNEKILDILKNKHCIHIGELLDMLYVKDITKEEFNLLKDFDERKKSQ